jgi:hypothetical protein
MRQRIVTAITSIGIGVLFLGASDGLLLAQRPPTVAQVRADFMARGYNGEYDPAAIQDALKAAGATNAQMDEIVKEIVKIVDKAKAKGKDAGKDQNANGKGDWNFGQVYRGQTYNASFPLQNDCRLGQTVTITYPASMDLTGPETVFVPAKSKVDVPIVLKIPDLPNFVGPIPLGVNFQCTPLDGDITMTHPELRRVETTPAGKYTYVCHESKVTYAVSLHAHLHDAPAPDPGGGGGGGPKKSKACDVYWRTGEFFPDKEHPTPDTCKTEMEELSVDMLTREIAPLEEKHDPGMFAWLPKSMDPAKIKELNALQAAAKKLSTEELVNLRRDAENGVRKIDCSMWENPKACDGSLETGR